MSVEGRTTMKDNSISVDELTDQAWREFRTTLADALAELDAGQHVTIALTIAGEATTGSRAQVFVLRTEEQFVLSASSNRLLCPQHKLSKASRRHLRGLGFQKPTDDIPAYTADVPLDRIDRAASVAVQVLREVFNTIHPAFLVSDDFTWATDAEALVEDAAPEASMVLRPTKNSQIEALVERTIAAKIGHHPIRDEQGDIALNNGSAVVFVARAKRGLVRLFSVMVRDVTDLDAAAAEVAELNQSIEAVKFTLLDDHVLASMDMLAVPFNPEHLETCIERLLSAVADHSEALARRVSAVVWFSSLELGDASTSDEVEPVVGPTDEQEMSDEENVDAKDYVDDEVDRVMGYLIQLNALEPVRPKQAAKVCGHDEALIAELIRRHEQQQINWMLSRDQARESNDYEEATVCEIERAAYEQATKVLRKALRRVLLR